MIASSRTSHTGVHKTFPPVTDLPRTKDTINIFGVRFLVKVRKTHHLTDFPSGQLRTAEGWHDPILPLKDALFANIMIS